MLAARAIAAIENPADVYVISSRPMGQRAVLKFARHTGATPIAGRFTPGAFTNQIQVNFQFDCVVDNIMLVSCSTVFPFIVFK